MDAMTLNKQKLARLIAETNRKYGPATLTLAGSEEQVIDRVDTKLPDLNAIIGGGLPKGRFIEISGLESAGKTTLAYYLCSLFGVATFIDAEGTFDWDRAKLFGNRKGQMIRMRPHWAEQAWEVLYKMAESGVPLIVVDSVPALVPKKNFEEKDQEKSPPIGQVARMMSFKLPVLAAKCEEHGTIVIWINQMRANMQAMAFGDPFTTPGGRALKHYCSIRMRVSRRGWIEGPKGKLGILSRIRVEKSKVSAPFGECELPMIFDRGYVTHSEAQDLVRAERKRRKEARVAEEEEDE